MFMIQQYDNKVIYEKEKKCQTHCNYSLLLSTYLSLQLECDDIPWVAEPALESAGGECGSVG